MASSARVFGRRGSVLMAASKTPAASVVAATNGSRPRGLLKPSSLSPAIGAFLGVSVVRPSDEIDEKIRKIWKNIKLNHLQNPRNKKEIVCDEKLKKLFEGKETVGYLEFSEVLKPHFAKP